MNREKVAAYLKRLTQDEGLRQEMEKAKSPEECLKIVKYYGFDFEPDEFRSLMEKVLIMAKKETGQELTDEELALAAGGLSGEEGILVGIGVSAVMVVGAVGLGLAAGAALAAA